MANPDALRDTRIPLTHASGAIPAVGFGALIPDCAERLVGRGSVKPSLNIAPRVRDRLRRKPRKGALPPV
jgi:hypothetical protein